MAPQYKLTYFPIKGLAESIRYLLSYLGADFEDNRIEFEQWPTIKPTTPFGKLPLLEIDGKTVCQSIAIARYLGKKAGIAGDNEWEALMIDAAVDTYRDLLQEMSGWFTEQDPEKKAKKLETLTGTTVPFYLGKFENLIAENDGYVANKKLSWGDIVIVALLEVTNSNVDLNLSEYPNVKGLFDKVLAIPNIKSWIDRRPEDKKRPT